MEMRQRIAELEKLENQRKRMEEELSKSKEYLEKIFNSVTDSIFVTDMKRKFVTCNQATERIFGYKKEEIIGKSTEMFYLNREAFEEMEHTTIKKIKEQGYFEGEVVLRRKDGSSFPAHATASLLTGTDGKPIGIVGVVRDITDYKRAQEEIQRMSRLNQEIIDNAPFGIITFDREGKVTQVNHRHLEIDRAPIKDPKKVIGYNIFEHPSIMTNKLLDPLRKILDGESFDMEIDNFKTLTNYEISVRVKGVPLVRKSGEVVGGLVIVEDITECKQAEKALQESEEKYRTIFELSPEAIVLLDKKGNLLDVNGRIYDWLGYKPEEVIGKNLSELPFLPEESKTKVIEKFSLRMSGKKIPSYEIEFTTKDGGKCIGNILATPIKDENGKIIGDLVMITDVTERKKMEEMLFQQEKMAALGRIAAVVSHELNTPLANISITAEYLSSKLQKRYADELRTIKSEVIHASDIIKRVLGFSRMGDIEIKQTDLNEIIIRAVNTVRKTCDTAGIIIQTNLSSSCPILGDEHKLLEAFTNILKNSIEAADPQKEEHRIDVNSTIEDDIITVTITDTGIGIDKNVQGDVLKPFFTTKPPEKGTGLGLFIAKWIIQKHGGNISITSEKNVGTTVTVTLPRKGV